MGIQKLYFEDNTMAKKKKKKEKDKQVDMTTQKAQY